MTRSLVRRSAVILAAVGVLASTLAGPVSAHRHHDENDDGRHNDNAVFFASDGMRQDLVARYASRGLMPTMGSMLRHGTYASGNGLLTQAPPNTGAGWYSLATGAWPGVHASTNNTFHINGSNFANSTSAFATGVLKAESIAQSAERGGLKVAQVEWAGGANATIAGPDHRLPVVRLRPRREHQLHRQGRRAAVRRRPLHRRLRPPVRHARGLCGPRPVPGRGADRRDRLDRRPAQHVQPGHGDAPPGARRGHRQVRPQRLDLRQHQQQQTDYDKVLFSPTKSAADAVATIGKGVFADVKVKVQGGALDGKTAGMLVRVEELTPDLSRVRLFHTSVSRAIATWPTWPGEPGFTGDFAEYLAQTFPTSTAADFAILEAGVTSEDTYADQGLYWATGHQPMLKYVMRKYHPDLLLAGVPTTDEFQHQFLGLVSPRLPNGAPNPAFDDVDLNGVPDGRLLARERYIREAYMEADETLTLARRLAGGDPVTFVSSDHGFAPQFLAVDASKPLVDLGLLSKPQTSNCRTPVGETIGSAKACWAGGAVQIYLNVVGRDPINAAPAAPFKQIEAKDVDATVAKIIAAYQGLSDGNDWTHDGQPEGWKVIDRVFTKAQARYIPNGPNSTADMAHPTRTGDVVAFSFPPYQFDAATPGTLIAPSHFFGQHGYVPDVQDLADNVNMRATFLADGPGIDQGGGHRADDRPRADPRLHPRHPRAPAEPGPGPDRDPEGRQLDQADLDRRHQRLPRPARPGHGRRRQQHQRPGRRGRVPGHDVRRGAGGPARSGPDPGRWRQRRRLAARTRCSSTTCRRSTSRTPGAWTRRPTATTSSTTASAVSSRTRPGRNFPFLATNIVETATGKAPPWVKTSVVFNVNGVKVGVIGAELQSTPDLVSADATAGLTFLDEATRIKAESQRLKKQGVKVQVVVIHQGTANGLNPIGNAAGVPWDGPILGIADQLQDTTVDAMIVGHTHRVSNLMRGDILITEGVNQGVTYSVLQLMVKGGDVDWAGGATRVAKDVGVAPRADVKAIVDDANAKTAVLRNKIIGTQSIDIKRDPARRTESALGDMIADAMREKYPTAGVEAAYTNSGGIRADLLVTPPSSAGEPAGSITWGEMFTILPFGNRTVIETLTGAQMKTAFENGFSAFCDPAINTGRFPQIAGLKVQFHCAAVPAAPVIDGIWKAPNGPSGTLTPLGPTDTVRFVTNDFMYTGGDGYAVFTQGTNVLHAGRRPAPGRDRLRRRALAGGQHDRRADRRALARRSSAHHRWPASGPAIVVSGDRAVRGPDAQSDA